MVAYITRFQSIMSIFLGSLSLYEKGTVPVPYLYGRCTVPTLFGHKKKIKDQQRNAAPTCAKLELPT
jgi:hypothetical protein